MREALDGLLASHGFQVPSGPRPSILPHLAFEGELVRRVVAASSGAAVVFGALVWLTLRDPRPTAPPPLPVPSSSGARLGAAVAPAPPELARSTAERPAQPAALAQPSASAADTESVLSPLPTPSSASSIGDELAEQAAREAPLPPAPLPEEAVPESPTSEELVPEVSEPGVPGADAGVGPRGHAIEPPAADPGDAVERAPELVPASPLGAGLPENPY
jgi:hypothetical protein